MGRGRLMGLLKKWYSPPLEGWQAQPDGVVVAVLHNQSILSISFMETTVARSGWVCVRFQYG